MLNKNKVAGRTPITNSLNSCQTNTLKESRVGERGGGGGCYIGERD